MAEDADARIKRALDYVRMLCGACKDCAKSACPSYILQHILRGEPVNECWLCGEVNDTVRDGLCSGCASDEETTDDCRAKAKEVFDRQVENGEALAVEETPRSSNG